MINSTELSLKNSGSLDSNPIQNITIDRFTVLALYAILPIMPEGTRIGIVYNKVVLQKPYNIIDITIPYFEKQIVLNSQSGTRWWHDNGKDDTGLFYWASKDALDWYQQIPDFIKMINVSKEGVLLYQSFYGTITAAGVTLGKTAEIIDQCIKGSLNISKVEEVAVKADQLKDMIRFKWTADEIGIVWKIIEVAYKKFNLKQNYDVEITTLQNYLDGIQGQGQCEPFFEDMASINKIGGDQELPK